MAGHGSRDLSRGGRCRPKRRRQRLCEQQAQSLAQRRQRRDLAEEGSDPRDRERSGRRADQQQQCRCCCRRKAFSLSANALGAFTLSDITRDLPGRFVARVAFDPNDPATVYAVLGGFSGFPGGHVFRTTLAGTGWTDISPPLDLPFNAIALDGSETPHHALSPGRTSACCVPSTAARTGACSTIFTSRERPVFELAFHNGELRAATFGRGVFSFVKPTGPAIAVGLEDNLAFGTVCQGSTHFLTIEVSNVGAADLVITSVQRLMGSAGFTVLPNPATPLILAAGEDIEFTVAYYADRRGRTRDRDDPNHHQRPERSRRRPLRDRHSGNRQDRDGDRQFRQLRKRLPRLDSPTNCLRSTIPEPARSRSSASPDRRTSSRRAFFPTRFLSAPATRSTWSSASSLRPLMVRRPGRSPSSATTRPEPRVVSVSGVLAAPKASLVIANTGSFGEVCVGSFADEPLIVTNSGRCALSITGISSSSGDFLAPEVLSYPITVGPGDALPVPIRFKPLGFGPKSGDDHGHERRSREPDQRQCLRRCALQARSRSPDRRPSAV